MRDPRGRCSDRYHELAEECRTRGVDAEEVKASATEHSEIRGGKAWVRKHAFEPTGLALGCPLPDGVGATLWESVLRLERWLATEGGVVRPVAFVPESRFHITIVNRTHFDKPGPAGLFEMTPEEVRAAAPVVAASPCNHIEVEFRGMILTNSARIIVPGFARTADLFDLRAALAKQNPDLAVNMPCTAHVKVGHLLFVPSSPLLRRLWCYLDEMGASLSEVACFSQVSSPHGCLPLGGLRGHAL